MLQPNAHKVYPDGQEIALTHKEYELLSFLMANPRQIFSREQLLNRVWGYDFEGTTRAVDTHIKTLRQKLGDEGRRVQPCRAYLMVERTPRLRQMCSARSGVRGVWDARRFPRRSSSPATPIS